MSTPGPRKGPGWVCAPSLPGLRLPGSRRNWVMGLVQRASVGAGSRGLSATNPHLHLSAEAGSKEGGAALRRSVFSAVCSHQCRQPADYLPTSHQAWLMITSSLRRKRGLSQWQDQGVAELKRQEVLGSRTPQGNRGQGAALGSTPSCPHTRPLSGHLTPGHTTTDCACLAASTLPCPRPSFHIRVLLPLSNS